MLHEALVFLSKELLNKGYSVIGTSRAGLIPQIKNDRFTVLKLDLSKSTSIDQFISELISTNMEVGLLINNAGIGPDLYRKKPDAISFDSTFEINVRGTLMLTEKLLSILSDNSKIINISSKMGSIDSCKNFDSVAYRMSKSALNMYTKILSNRLTKVKIAAIHPGWVKTTIGNNKMEGRLTPDQSATRIIDYIENNFTNGDFWDVEYNLKLNW